MNDIKLVKQALQSLELSMSRTSEDMDKMVIALRTCHYDVDLITNVPLKSTKPYFRMKEKW